MSSSPSNQKIAHHARSISLPSRSHPLTLTVEEQLCKLRSLEASSSSSISHNLAGLNDLFECVEDFLQMQHTQQILSLNKHEKWVDGVLDGSLMLLDVCSTTRDVVSQMKQAAQDLQSSFRRRSGELDLANEISLYMVSRKQANKVIRKSLRDIKRNFNKCLFPLLDNDQDLVSVVRVLREVEAATVAVFESLLSFLSGPKARSLVSKLMHTKRVGRNGEQGASEVNKVDSALSAFISQKLSEQVDVKNVQNLLEALERSVQDYENGLEFVFRRLIKTRVSILNVLNH